VLLKECQFILSVAIPGINVLTHHDRVNTDIPHHRGAMSAGLQVVINLFPLVGAFNGRAAFIDRFPLIRFP